jgi:hypothetical protein
MISGAIVDESGCDRKVPRCGVRSMKWLYFIPHVWDGPDARATWEDVYLKPLGPDYRGESLWLTVDALGDETIVEHGADRQEFREEALRKLGSMDHWIGDGDMIVRAVDFTRDELLGWVKIWLEHHEFAVTELVEGSRAAFAGTNDHARAIEAAMDRMPDDFSD